MESIGQLHEEIKEKYNTNSARKRDALIVIIVLLVGTLSFGLGFLAGSEEGGEPIRVGEREMNMMPAATYAARQQEEGMPTDGVVVGSVNSDKYHLPWCSGAQRINEGNKVYFNSEKEAREAGYEPAGNCPGLSE